MTGTARLRKVWVMRYVLLSLAALFFASAAFAQSKSKKEPAWQTFESELMNYKTAFPGKPKEVTKKPASKAGDLIVNTASLETKDIVYAVTATIYPEKLKDVDPKKLFSSAKDALSANGGKIITDEAITVTGPNEAKHEGREVTVEFGKNRVRTRLLLVNLVLFQVSVTGTEKALQNPLAGKFVSAFEVTK